MCASLSCTVVLIVTWLLRLCSVQVTNRHVDVSADGLQHTRTNWERIGAVHSLEL